MGENRPRQPHFAEYSLWNDSAYSVFSVPPVNLITFTRPVSDSIFLSPPLEEKSNDEIQAEAEQQNRSPGFERYMKRALKVVTREDLLKDPALFKRDADSDDSDHDPEFRSTFVRPPRPRWRTAQQVNGRGRRLNLMQRRLEQALAQPANIQRGASMMQRMGWEGGALGRGGGGILTPIPPNPSYSHSTAGFGLGADSAQDSPDSSSEQSTKRTKIVQRTKKQSKREFEINTLLFIREFVKNDLQIELFFEPQLKNHERKRIHQMVAHLMETEEYNLGSMEMAYLAKDIIRRNCYVLGTQSDGNPPHRQICVYKEANDTMYLVTPDDIRYPPEIETEEETNPFLKSITKHLKNDSEPEKTPTLLDKIIDFFVEFSAMDEYNEFRFLGPFHIEEIDIMSTFFSMVTCLVEKRPYLDYPERLVKVFEKGISYSAEEDLNGFVSVKKHIKVKEEDKQAEKQEDKEE